MDSFIFEDDEDYGDNDDIQQMNIMLWRIMMIKEIFLKYVKLMSIMVAGDCSKL